MYETDDFTVKQTEKHGEPNYAAHRKARLRAMGPKAAAVMLLASSMIAPVSLAAGNGHAQERAPEATSHTRANAYISGANSRSRQIWAEFFGKKFSPEIPDWVQGDPNMLRSFKSGAACVDEAFNRAAEINLNAPSGSFFPPHVQRGLLVEVMTRWAVEECTRGTPVHSQLAPTNQQLRV